MIYRIEHPETKKGPYTHHRTGVIWRFDTTSYERLCYDRPEPYREFNGYEIIREIDFCGFNSLEQLFKWFLPEDIMILALYGFEIVNYIDIEIIRSGANQIIFRKS